MKKIILLVLVYASADSFACDFGKIDSEVTVVVNDLAKKTGFESFVLGGSIYDGSSSTYTYPFSLINNKGHYGVGTAAVSLHDCKVVLMGYGSGDQYLVK